MKKVGRPVEKENGVHCTCLSFDKETFLKFKELSKDLHKKSITAFLEDLMREQLKVSKQKSDLEDT